MKKKYNWIEINEKLDKLKFSAIGCILPSNIESELKEIIQMTFNQVYMNPQSDNFINKVIVFSENNQDNIYKFSDEQLDILEGILSEVQRDEIASRIGVILWFERKNHEACLKAIDAYKRLFKVEKDTENNLATLHVMSAYNLMTQLGKEAESNKYIEQIIDESMNNNKEITYMLLDFLTDKKKFSNLSTNAKTRYKEYLDEEAKNWKFAEIAGEILVKIAQKENNLKAEKKAYSYIASFWYNMAMLPNEPIIRKADHHANAAKFYKKAGNEEKANYCLIESRKASQDQEGWHKRSKEIDLSPVHEYFASLDDANIVTRIGFIANLTRVNFSQIESFHKDKLSSKENSIYGIFSEKSIDSKGVVRSVRSGAKASKDSSEISYLMNHAVSFIGLYSSVILIGNTKYVLSEVKDVTFSEIIDAILPTNVQMVDFILRTVLSGNGEMVVESLMVTFETFLAALVERSGIASVKQKEDGTQEDISMGPLIDICRNNQLMDKDDLFLIESLLCNNNGLNLRNLSSHRLTSDIDRTNTSTSSYYLFCGYFLIRLFIDYS